MCSNWNLNFKYFHILQNITFFVFIPPLSFKNVKTFLALGGHIWPECPCLLTTAVDHSLSVCDYFVTYPCKPPLPPPTSSYFTEKRETIRTPPITCPHTLALLPYLGTFLKSTLLFVMEVSPSLSTWGSHSSNAYFSPWSFRYAFHCAVISVSLQINKHNCLPHIGFISYLSISLVPLTAKHSDFPVHPDSYASSVMLCL